MGGDLDYATDPDFLLLDSATSLQNFTFTGSDGHWNRLCVRTRKRLPENKLCIPLHIVLKVSRNHLIHYTLCSTACIKCANGSSDDAKSSGDVVLHKHGKFVDHSGAYSSGEFEMFHGFNLRIDCPCLGWRCSFNTGFSIVPRTRKRFRHVGQ